MLKRAKNRKSKVELLPEDIRASIGALIRSGDMTQKDILAAVNEMIDEAGLPEDAKISRTSFNRYAQRMENRGARIREAREVAEVWTTKLGDAPVSEVGKLLQEFVRTMAFETSMHMMDEAADGGEPIPPKALGQLARSCTAYRASRHDKPQGGKRNPQSLCRASRQRSRSRG